MVKWSELDVVERDLSSLLPQSHEVYSHYRKFGSSFVPISKDWPAACVGCESMLQLLVPPTGGE